MQATQSSTASGTWCRDESVAALLTTSEDSRVREQQDSGCEGIPQRRLTDGAEEPGSEGQPRPGILTDVYAEEGDSQRGLLLVETAAGWIAC